jgi:hypothetical protein
MNPLKKHERAPPQHHEEGSTNDENYQLYPPGDPGN